jgi:hypothetical protein
MVARTAYVESASDRFRGSAEGKPLSFIGRVQKWWQGTTSPSSPAESYSVTCSCGHVVAGVRQRRRQEVVCPGCSRLVFVLPSSPWLATPLAGLPRPSPSAPLSAWGASAHAWRWRMPLIAALATLTLVVIGFWLILPYLDRLPDTSPLLTQRDSQQLIATGRQALAEGNFFLAERQFTAAVERTGSGLIACETRDIEQLRRQAGLLSRLQGRSLEEILSEALPLRSDEEWKERFRAEHRGKAIVFDDVVGHDSSGRPALAVYRIRVSGERARVALEQLRLLRQLPLNPPQRLLFGARLADLAREEGGGWVFNLDPDSGVLLTDEGAVAACLGPPDSDLLEVLRRQQDWLAALAPPTDPR